MRCQASSATQSFSAIVRKLNAPTLASVPATNGQPRIVVSGDFGPDYTIQGSTNLSTWTNLFQTNSPVLPFGWSDTNLPAPPQRYYRALLGN